MNYAGGRIPSGAQLNAEGAGQLGDANVARFIIAQAILTSGRDLGREAEIGGRHGAVVIVQLRRIIIAFGFAEPADRSGLFKRQMHMMKQRNIIIEKFGIHRPSAVFLQQLHADRLRAELRHRVAERKFIHRIVGRRNIAHALVGSGKRAVVRRDYGRKPALLDGTAARAQREIIVGMQLQPMAGL